MSARSRRRGAPATPAPPGEASARGLHPVALGAIVLVAIVIGVWLVRANREAATMRAVDPTALVDSLRTADASKDWVTTLRLAEALGRIRPRDHSVLLARGSGWSNYALAQRPGRVLERPALRTSLERVACFRRSMVLTDSAGIVAPTEQQWINAMHHLGDLEESLGLPGDALLAHEAVKQRKPDEMTSALRAYWLRALLYDPVNPDTSAFDRRMREMHLR